MSSFYSFFLTQCIMPIGDFINKSRVTNELKKWRRISNLTEFEIEDKTNENLASILNFAVTNIEFYRKKEIARDLNPKQFLRNFPILEKSDLRTCREELVLGEANNLIACKSSGSSGIQTTTFQNKSEQSVNRAIQLLWWEWAGYYPGKPLIQTGINPKRGVIKKLKDILFRTTYVAAFAHEEKEVVEILNNVRGKKNVHFGGCASSLNVFAEVARKHSINDVQFDAAISWGDKLFDHYKRNIKEVFNCEIFETYGCSEGILVASKKDLDYYYIMSPHVYVEIVDDNGNEVKDGEWGHILLTRLDNYSMPLIRYKIGDLGSLLPRSEYPKNREFKFPLLKEIIGRSTDVVKTPSGKKMVVHAFTGIFEHISEIQQFKITQRDLAGIEIEYIAGVNFNLSILKKIEEVILNHLNEDFLIHWKSVNEISPSPSGKPRLVECLI